MIPAESYASLASSDERLREISLLQQRARSSEVEIACRVKLERALSRREREIWDFFDNAVDAYFENGEFVHTRCFTRDVAERHQAEEALRESEQRFRRLMELLPAAVYTCDAPSAEIRYYNRRAAELWGREPALGSVEERFCGSFRLFQTDGTRLQHAECPMAAVLAGGPPVRDQEVVIERPDGSRITVLVNIDPITDVSGSKKAAIRNLLSRKKSIV